ncbi:HEPN domain-containing protein [Gordonia sp. (in: high G+C Gram-positive bacteria)]|uniref:ApeA N-terminal domain 1-containing protein n=1 Tax=Gordonia sp. (in: high G+C Gram-positive bacteria) TaxID=84139 RepID=UPI0035AF9546
MTEHRYVGQWWLPGQRERSVGGILEVSDPGNIRLEIAGRFFDPFGGASEPLDVVHGAADGRSITLFDVIRYNGSEYRRAAQEDTDIEVLSPAVCLLGVHLESQDDCVFSEMVVEVSHLTTWSCRSGFKWGYTEEPGGGTARTFVLAPVRSIGAEFDEAFDIEFDWGSSRRGPNSDAESRKLVVEETVRLRVSAGLPQAWNGFEHAVAAIRDLVTLATQSPCIATNRVLLIHLPQRPKYPLRVESFMRSRPIETSKVGDHDLLFRLHNIDLDDAIKAWRQLRELVGLSIHVLFGIDYHPSVYYENQLLNAASAAEGLHAKLFPNSTAIDPVEHKVLRASLKTLDLSAERKQWLFDQTGHNRPGLQKRLLELCDVPDQQAVDSLLHERELWARWLSRARNAIAHADDGQLQKGVPEEVRYRLTYVTKALLHLVLLERIGVSAELQRSAVENQWIYVANAFEVEVEKERVRLVSKQT